MRLTVINHLSLDGVVQGPGRADEDTRGGFTQGGWAAPRSDDQMLAAVGRRMGAPGTSLLLGRVSHDDMLGHWNEAGGPFRDALNAMPKYVASRNLDVQLPWPNTTLLAGDVAAEVAQLKETTGDGADTNLVTMGSGDLVRSLLSTGLIDEYLLMVHPVVLGNGTRLFPTDGPSVDLRLTGSEQTATGVVLATYEPA